jgi:hypothetical protein
LRELVQQRLVARAQADRRHVAREHARGVAHRLAARELQLAGAQHHRVAAELGDAGLEGDARAGRGLLEDQGDAAAGERLRGERRGLELRGAVEEGVQLG